MSSIIRVIGYILLYLTSLRSDQVGAPAAEAAKQSRILKFNDRFSISKTNISDDDGPNQIEKYISQIGKVINIMNHHAVDPLKLTQVRPTNIRTCKGSWGS